MDQLANTLNALVALAQSDLDVFWRELDALTQAAADGDQRARETLEAAMHDVLPGLISSYQSAAVEVAASSYDNRRADLGISDRVGDGFRAQGVELPDGGHALAGWAASTAQSADGFQGLVAGGVQRRIMDAGRRTVMDAAITDPHCDGWMRQGRGSTCKFCRMLVGRGAVYSERTADFASHDHCHCVAVAAFHGAEKPAKTYTPSTRSDRTDPVQRAAGDVRAREWIEANLDEGPRRRQPKPSPRVAQSGNVLDQLPRLKQSETSAAAAEKERRATNPNFTEAGYGVNCQRVIHAYELRRRGYDVTARPNLVDDKSGTARVYMSWLDGGVERLEKGSRHNVSPALKKLVDQQFPDQADKFITNPTKFARSEIESWPVGARGIVRFGRDKNAGHVFNVERTADGVKVNEAQDPGATDATLESYMVQVSKTKKTRSGHLKLRDPGDISVVRTDDLQFNQGVLEAITWSGRKP